MNIFLHIISYIPQGSIKVFSEISSKQKKNRKRTIWRKRLVINENSYNLNLESFLIKVNM